VLLPSPTGGFAVVDGEISSSGWSVGFRRIDANGSAAGARVLIASGPERPTVVPQVVAAISPLGHTLVFYETSSLCRAQWLDKDGQPLTPQFEPAGCAEVGSLLPLVDGAMVYVTLDSQSYRHARAAFADASAVPGPVPSFLAQDPVMLRGYNLLPGGKGYAIWNDGLEIYAPAGNKCGTVHAADAIGPPRVGLDGSLLVADWRDPACGTAWWPQVWR
jgi:hypothetical protein